MFFTVNEVYDIIVPLAQDRRAYGARQLVEEVRQVLSLRSDQTITRHHIRKFLRIVKDAIQNRQTRVSIPFSDDWINVGKWVRPWEVLPRLKEFRAPDGEYAVGVEVELGFTSLANSRKVAKVLRNWKHVALDYEGGDHPIEATFPPVLYSKFNGSQAVRYLKYLNSTEGVVQRHNPRNQIGTHVNVSKGLQSIPGIRLGWVNHYLSNHLSQEEKAKYFGRSIPYRYMQNQTTYIECKMFNSVTDPRVLKRYVHIAVALSELVFGTEAVTPTSVRTALEKGYNKRT